MALGDVEPLAEDPADLPDVVQHRGVDEIQQPLGDRSGGGVLQPGRHVMGDRPLAGGVGPVEHLEKALAGQLRKGVAHGLADELARSEQPPVGLVDELEHMVGARESADEPRRLLEKPLLALLLRRLATCHQNRFSRLRDRAEHSRHFAGLVADR